MKIRNYILASVGILSFSLAQGQSVSKDSIAQLKKEKQVLQYKLKIKDIQLDLADECNNLYKLRGSTADLQKDAEKQTQNSNDMSGNVNTGDAKSAKEAEKAAKKAIAANKKLSSNKADIAKSEKKIFDYNYEIQTYNKKVKALDPSYEEVPTADVLPSSN